MIPPARVQQGPSEAARCASTGIVPATPPLFSILLSDTVARRSYRQIRIKRQTDFRRATTPENTGA